METALQTIHTISPQQPKAVDEAKTESYPHDKLLAALFFFWDGFERSSMNFFLVKQTAEQVMSNSELSGDRITLGIRRTEWRGGQAGIFKDFMEHEGIVPVEKTKEYLKFVYQDVPVYLYFYPDSPTLTSFDVYFYCNETFNVPNPYLSFVKEFEQ